MIIKRIHIRFMHKMNRLKEEFMSGEVVLRTEIMSTLKNWLTDHIMNEDKNYAGFKMKGRA